MSHCIGQIEIATVPSGHFSTAVVEPYNAVFSTHESLTNSDCALFFDNQSLYNMLSKKLEMFSPTYRDINRMIAQVGSHLVSCLNNTHGGLVVSLVDVVCTCTTKYCKIPTLNYSTILKYCKMLKECDELALSHLFQIIVSYTQLFDFL